MIAILPLTRFYQFGFIAHSIDAAIGQFGERYGVSRFRRSQPASWMKSAHAWTGDTMLEILEIGAGAPALYADNLPEAGAVARLHHLGYRVAPEDWPALETAIANAGIGTDMMGSVMDGQLRYAYADTRHDLGIYTEFVCLSGAALGIYDDVPRH